MCPKFKAEHAEDNTHSESLLHEKVSWNWFSLVPRPSLSMHNFCVSYAKIVRGERGPGNEASIGYGLCNKEYTT